MGRKIVTVYAQIAMQVNVDDSELENLLDDLERDNVTVSQGTKWQAMDVAVTGVDEYEIMQVEDVV